MIAVYGTVPIRPHRYPLHPQRHHASHRRNPLHDRDVARRAPRRARGYPGAEPRRLRGTSVDHVCRKLQNKILSRASRLVEICQRVGSKYGIPVVNKRLAISPVSTILAGHGHAAAVQVARTLDSAAAACDVDFVGGFTALVHKGISAADAVVMNSLPDVLSQTKQVCASVNVASRKAGINMDAIHQMGHVILKIAQATADKNGFGCAKLVVFANIPEDNPFMAGAYMGAGEPDATVNIGVSGPGVVSSALKRRIAR